MYPTFLEWWSIPRARLFLTFEQDKKPPNMLLNVPIDWEVFPNSIQSSWAQTITDYTRFWISKIIKLCATSLYCSQGAMCNRIMATVPRDKNDCNHISLHPDRPEKFLKEQKCMLHSKLWQPIWDNLSVTEMQENYCGAAQIPAELRNPTLAAGSLTPHQLKI